MSSPWLFLLTVCKEKAGAAPLQSWMLPLHQTAWCQNTITTKATWLFLASKKLSLLKPKKTNSFPFTLLLQSMHVWRSMILRATQNETVPSWGSLLLRNEVSTRTLEMVLKAGVSFASLSLLQDDKCPLPERMHQQSLKYYSLKLMTPRPQVNDRLSLVVFSGLMFCSAAW